jgi:hypothetical protein
MGYLDKHLAYRDKDGTTLAEQQFNATANNTIASFADSPFYKIAIINGQQVGVRLQDITAITRGNTIETLQYSMKYMQLLPNTVINIGDIVQIDDDQFWIVTDSVSDNSLFPKVKIMMCNYLLTVKTGGTKTLKGHDSLNRPVYHIQDITDDVHALVRGYLSGNTLNQPINSPTDRLYITIKYDDTAKAIKDNDILNLYDNDYKVIGIDFSNVVNTVGCISIMADRVTSTS